MSGTMLEVRHLRLVRALAEEGGPTRAAARLHLTQSAVSHQLAELEGRLGVVLFTRVRRQFKLTPAGARLVEAARDLLSDLARVERSLQSAGGPKRELLRIATECFTSYHWLPAVLTKLAAEHPHVDVRIVPEATREPLVALLAGQLELAVISSPTRDRELVSLPLFEDEWTVIVARSHRFAARAFVGAAELSEETLFAHDAPRGDVERLRELLKTERAPMPRTLPVPFTDALVELVIAGLGIAIVSRWAVAPWLARGDVAACRFTRAGLHETWSAVYRRDAAARLPLARFAELVRSEASERAPNERSPRRPRR